MNSSIACDPNPIDQPRAKSVYRTKLLVARRKYTPPAEHHAALTARLHTLLAQHQPRCIGVYWPLAGEFDARPVLAQWLAQSPSHSAALPVIVRRDSHLEFWRWTPESPMSAGDFGISIPAQKELLRPDLLLIPCLGFDSTRLRLGYGGGYYDRTLATCSPRPITIGLAYEYGHLPALPREPHDIPLDCILSETACYI